METVDIEQLQTVADATKRARQAGELIDVHQGCIAELSRLRREALDELISEGKTQTQIAKDLGMTRSRIGQLLTSGPQPERAFLGSGTLTVALGGKLEAGKDDPGSVVSEGSLAAYNQVAELAHSLGLRSESEIIPQGGIVNLNRTNLVVICGPRLSPIVAQILESDPNLQFAKDNDGWHIVDSETGTVHRSPIDSGENADIGYIARLRRPDGKGTFLYMAGIHAAGSAAAAHYIEHNLADLYREVKTRRFSALVTAEVGDDLKVNSSELVTPIYKHESIS